MNHGAYSIPHNISVSNNNIIAVTPISIALTKCKFRLITKSAITLYDLVEVLSY